VRRNAVILFTVVFIVAGDSSRGEGNGLKVEAAGPRSVEAKPREVVTAAFRVSNVSKEKREIMGRVSLPAGWQLVTEDPPFQLEAGQSDVRLISFLAPRTALAGRYEVSYLAADTANPSISDSSSINVAVLPVAKVEATVVAVPQYVVGGEDYRAHFWIVNPGNCPCTAAVKIESSDGFPAQADAETVGLAPGESKKVAVTVKTDPTLRREMTHRLKLTATTRGPDGREISASARTFVDVIPLIAGIEDPFHRLPVRMRLRGVMERYLETEMGIQGEVSGSGTLDEQGKRNLDFLFRGPDTEDVSILGERDEYRVSYDSESYGFHLGDRGYSLSPLTELFQYGRGAEGWLNVGNFDLGAYHQESRWLIPQEEQTAAHAGYRISEKYQVGLNYLKKNATGSLSRREVLLRAIF